MRIPNKMIWNRQVKIFSKILKEEFDIKRGIFRQDDVSNFKREI